MKETRRKVDPAQRPQIREKNGRGTDFAIGEKAKIVADGATPRAERTTTTEERAHLSVALGRHR